jgi:hypothetical protein
VERIAANDALVNPADITNVVAGVGVLLPEHSPLDPSPRRVSSYRVRALRPRRWVFPLPVPDIEPIERRLVTERLAEVAVIVALMGVGLALDRPFG